MQKFNVSCPTFPDVILYFSFCPCVLMYVVFLLGEQGMVDEAQRALEEAEALKKVSA